jgi:hypothetical protein
VAVVDVVKEGEAKVEVGLVKAEEAKAVAVVDVVKEGEARGVVADAVKEAEAADGNFCPNCSSIFRKSCVLSHPLFLTPSVKRGKFLDS